MHRRTPNAGPQNEFRGAAEAVVYARAAAEEFGIDAVDVASATVLHGLAQEVMCHNKGHNSRGAMEAMVNEASRAYAGSGELIIPGSI